MAKGSIRKALVVTSALVVIGSSIAMWNLNHEFMAFLNVMISGMIILAALGLAFGKENNASAALIGAVIASVISITFYAKNSTDYNVEKTQEKAAVVAKKAEQAAAEKARRDALTPEERKKEDFVAERQVRGYLLTQQIKASAFDPDSLKLKAPENYKNGVCVMANGKNRFGAYVGFQEYCYLYENDKWTYSGPN